MRWWNVRRPADYARRLNQEQSPAAGSEVLTEEDKALEAVMLGVRMRRGLEIAALSDAGARAAQDECSEGRVEIAGGRVTLTLKGRLFADAVARRLSS